MPKGKKNKKVSSSKNTIKENVVNEEVVENAEETLEVTETVETKEPAKKTQGKETKKSQDKPKKHFMKDFKAELKRVIWPTPKQLANNTIAVISIVLLTAIIVFVLDFTFEKMNTYGINQLKTLVESKEDTNTTNETENTNTTNTAEDQNTTAENNQVNNQAE